MVRFMGKYKYFGQLLDSAAARGHTVAFFAVSPGLF
jgi:hypothetical protein